MFQLVWRISISLVAFGGIAMNMTACKQPARIDPNAPPVLHRDYRASSTRPAVHIPAPQALHRPDGVEAVETPAPAATVRPSIHPVKEGTLPLVYLVETESPVRVVDLKTGRPLASGTIPRRSIVRIDSVGGVHFGSAHVLAGPLSPDHRYAIFIDPPEGSTSRTRTTERLKE